MSREVFLGENMDDTLAPVVGGMLALVVMIAIMVVLERGKAEDEITYLRLDDGGNLTTVKSGDSSFPRVKSGSGITFKSVED